MTLRPHDLLSPLASAAARVVFTPAAYDPGFT
jgi:hypothetical protein